MIRMGNSTRHKRVKATQEIIIDRFKAVFLLWFSVACFCVGFGDVSPYVYTVVLVRSRLLSGNLLGKSFPLG